MNRCKEKDGYIKEVMGAPEPVAFLATDRQLKDIELYCTHPSNYSILGVDATFNLGDFMVTPTTYRPLKIYDVNTGKSPVFLGPMLIHQSKTQQVYSILPSSMKRFNPCLAQVQAFGTDGEIPLSSAFKQEFPVADHHLCSLHFKRNMESKLSSIGVHGKEQLPFIRDILGGQVGETFHRGIVHSEDNKEFYAKLCSLESVWNERETAVAGNDPVFYAWFVRYHADAVESAMLQPLRVRAGLGDSLYCTNDNEGLNNLLKQRTGYQRVSLIELTDKAHQIVNEQDAILEGAILRQGDARLTEPYSHLEISPERWRKMKPIERRNYLKKAKESGPSSENVPIGMSVSASDSGIRTVPASILQNQFAKAGRLLKSKQVVRGFDTESNSLLVASDSSEKPHVVTQQQNGKFTCDDCAAYYHSWICAHTLAAAEFDGRLSEFLTWFNVAGQGTNVSRMADFGIDTKKSGKKP